jgi:hypothetical protein
MTTGNTKSIKRTSSRKTSANKSRKIITASKQKSRKTKERTKRHENKSVVKDARIIAQTIYHEGGDCYREIVIVKARQPWITPNIAFFQSTGRSNKGYEKLAGTWFPTIGIQPFRFSNDENESFALVKMGFLKKESLSIPRELSDILNGFMDYLLEDERMKAIHTHYVSSVVLDKTLSKPQEISKYRYPFFNELNDFINMLEHYFINTNQIQTSIELGGGIWSLQNEYFVQLFLQYFAISNHSINPIRREPVPELSVCRISSENSHSLSLSSEDIRINDFLTQHNSYMDMKTVSHSGVVEYVPSRSYLIKLNGFTQQFNILMIK